MNTTISNTCTLEGREYRAVPARRGCQGCAAQPRDMTSGRDAELCNALPPCDCHRRGGGCDVIWITRGAPPRKSGSVYPDTEPGHGAGRVTQGGDA